MRALVWTADESGLRAVLPFGTSAREAADVRLTLTAEEGLTVCLAPESASPDGGADLLAGAEIVVSDGRGRVERVPIRATRAANALPVICIDTADGTAITSRDEYVTATFSMETPDGAFDVEASPIRIRGRGHSTWVGYPKKPYKIKFDSQTSILLLSAAKE